MLKSHSRSRALHAARAAGRVSPRCPRGAGRPVRAALGRRRAQYMNPGHYNKMEENRYGVPTAFR